MADPNRLTGSQVFPFEFFVPVLKQTLYNVGSLTKFKSHTVPVKKGINLDSDWSAPKISDSFLKIDHKFGSSALTETTKPGKIRSHTLI